MSEPLEDDTKNAAPGQGYDSNPQILYRVVFRQKGQVTSCISKINNLALEENVMVQTDHGLEPAIVFKKGIALPESFQEKIKDFCVLVRRASRDEVSKFENLILREEEAFALCNQRIAELDLKMKLISVERYFNGSKILFYFTSDNRVDFRELVKKLVQEFRTRVEMKQIGVRHETKMIGGLGCCGRELCCSSFIGKFAPVSIKMAKEQDLPLNPVKISGVCNRLLCCLTHEYSTYKAMRKDMPRPGRKFTLDGKEYKVLQCNVLSEAITVVSDQGEAPFTMAKEEWKNGVFEAKPQKQVEGEKSPAKKAKTKKNWEANANQAPQKAQQKANKQSRQKK
jgi:cell fate regulator YaaT (PSP1 superfamily)